jgi:hypothetical protein
MLIINVVEPKPQVTILVTLKPQYDAALAPTGPAPILIFITGGLFKMSQTVKVSKFPPVLQSHFLLCGSGSGKNFDAALAPVAPAPTLLYSMAKFLK